MVCFGIVLLGLVVWMVVMFDCLLGGCLLINVVMGGDVVEFEGDGFFVDYDMCYEIIDDFLNIWCGLFVVLYDNDGFDYIGKYL